MEVPSHMFSQEREHPLQQRPGGEIRQNFGRAGLQVDHHLPPPVWDQETVPPLEQRTETEKTLGGFKQLFTPQKHQLVVW